VASECTLVRWLRTALRNLDEEASFIAVDDIAAGRLVVRCVLGAVSLLAEQPGMGRPGHVPGTRELIVSKTRYIVPYRVRGETVEVLRVFHTPPAARPLVAIRMSRPGMPWRLGTERVAASGSKRARKAGPPKPKLKGQRGDGKLTTCQQVITVRPPVADGAGGANRTDWPARKVTPARQAVTSPASPK